MITVQRMLSRFYFWINTYVGEIKIDLRQFAARTFRPSKGPEVLFSRSLWYWVQTVDGSVIGSRMSDWLWLNTEHSVSWPNHLDTRQRAHLSCSRPSALAAPRATADHMIRETQTLLRHSQIHKAYNVWKPFAPIKHCINLICFFYVGLLIITRRVC